MTFSCPRCGVDVDERFYGPCAGCREQLHDLMPPPRDMRFRPTTLQDGRHYMAYVGEVVTA